MEKTKEVSVYILKLLIWNKLFYSRFEKKNCIIGQKIVPLHPVFSLGNNVKMQHNVSTYTRVTCDDDFLLGLSRIFTSMVNSGNGIHRREAYARTHTERRNHKKEPEE